MTGVRLECEYRAGPPFSRPMSNHPRILDELSKLSVKDKELCRTQRVQAAAVQSSSSGYNGCRREGWVAEKKVRVIT